MRVMVQPASTTLGIEILLQEGSEQPIGIMTSLLQFAGSLSRHECEEFPCRICPKVRPSDLGKWCTIKDRVQTPSTK